MAETSFFGMTDDAVALCHWLIDRYACTFLVDGTEEANPPEIREKEGIKELIQSAVYGPRFFVKSPEWSRFPIPFSRIKTKDGRVLTHVDQRYGGPAFDLICGNVFKQERKIVVGWVMDYSHYYVKSGNSETFARPDAMTEAMKTIRSYLRRNGSRTLLKDSGKETAYWALPGAIAMFSKGWKLVQGDWEFIPKHAEPSGPANFAPAVRRPLVR